MKVFRLSDGRIVQIIDKDKIQRWDPATPALFVNYILDKKIESYGSSKDQAEIRAYLNEILEEIAVPKLTSALKSPDPNVRLTIAKNLVDISKKKADMVKGVLSFLQEAEKNETETDIKANIAQVLKNYDKAVKRKQYEAKRKKMKELDERLKAGKITADEYVKERKEFLLLGVETGAEEE
ncbi:MAG: HEAT repeat domain-containing protein [Candidatus Sigynarchaeota archaeon]